MHVAHPRKLIVDFRPIAAPRRFIQALANTWNQVEIVHQNGIATSRLNGQQVSQVAGFRVAWPSAAEADLRCGNLQLQSEGAEIFFRRVVIQELP